MRLQGTDVTGFEALSLDRDGVINRFRPDDYVKKWGESEFLPGVLEILKVWNTYFKYVFIVTSQRGVGEEIMNEEDSKHIHERMTSEVKSYRGRIDRIYYCTALTNSDVNRKPGIGTFLQILGDYLDIDKAKCLMIGDNDSDIKFAKSRSTVGTKVI